MVKYEKLNHLEPSGLKIADITHADTVQHAFDFVAAGLPPNTVALEIVPGRASGTGTFNLYIVSGGHTFVVATGTPVIWIRSTTGFFYYALSVKNDDWDIWCLGYWIAQPERK